MLACSTEVLKDYGRRVKVKKQSKQQELSLGQIARLMGVSKATINGYLEGYPYQA